MRFASAVPSACASSVRSRPTDASTKATAASVTSADALSPSCVGVSTPPCSSSSGLKRSPNLWLPEISQRVRSLVAPRSSDPVESLARRCSRGDTAADSAPVAHSFCACSTTVPMRFSRRLAGSGDTTARSALPRK